jgi:drug/metabolite transporter (DMT)-like permease
METIIATTSAAVCKVNGQVVPCEQFWGVFKWVLGAGLGLGAGMFLIFILASIFWLWMLIHAIKSPIEHKPVWFLVLLLTGFIGAVIYYFAVKRVAPPVVAK